MPHRVAFAPEAKAQLVSLYEFIAARGNPAAALSFTEAIVTYCDGFAVFPRRGTRRDDLRPGLRTIAFRRRVTIAFHVGPRTVTVLGVFYAGQDVSASLGQS